MCVDAVIQSIFELISAPSLSYVLYISVYSNSPKSEEKTLWAKVTLWMITFVKSFLLVSCITMQNDLRLTRGM